MGAYAFVEWYFGGISWRVFEHVNIPIAMRLELVDHILDSKVAS